MGVSIKHRFVEKFSLRGTCRDAEAVEHRNLGVSSFSQLMRSDPQQPPVTMAEFGDLQNLDWSEQPRDIRDSGGSGEIWRPEVVWTKGDDGGRHAAPCLAESHKKMRCAMHRLFDISGTALDG